MKLYSLLCLVLVAILLIGYRFWPKIEPKTTNSTPIVAASVENWPKIEPNCDSSAFWKEKYDSLHGVWTEARERFFTKKKTKIYKDEK